MLKSLNFIFSVAAKYFSPLVIIIFISGCQPNDHSLSQQRQELSTEIDSVLNDQYNLWYPRAVDNKYGGFFSRYSHDWQPLGLQDKFIVTQARHVWSASKIAFMDEGRNEFIDYGKHGFNFLRDKMWDDEYGGFYQTVSRKGEVKKDEDGSIRKTLYGNAFALYGLSAYYQASGDTAALELAQKTFQWLDEGSYDSKYGGYFNSLNREGQPYESGYSKDYNSGIHILEALAELYQVWPDKKVHDRLQEMVRVVRDTFTTDRGYMNLYFKRDWTPVVYKDSSRALQEENLGVDHITFGHDIETAFLLIEAAHALELSEDSVLTNAKKMVDHTIDNAWDTKEGGFYNRGYYFEGDQELTVTDSSKVWWAQAEALHSLLIMAKYFPDDPNYDYFVLFANQWNYIKNYLLDSQYGGWYESGFDEDPDVKEVPKATIWKGNYHTMRALMRCKELLKNKEL